MALLHVTCDFTVCLTGVVGLARLQVLHEVIAASNWTLVVEPLKLHDVSFSYMQLRNLDVRDTTDKYIILDLSSADALATVLKQVSCYLLFFAPWLY